MKLSTKLLDNLCRMEKKTTVLGGGVALFDKQANIDFFFRTLPDSPYCIIVVNQAKHHYV